MAFSHEKRFVISLLMILGTWASLAMSRALNEDAVSATFDQWMAQHGRVYVDDAEKVKRLKIFKDNLEHIESVNSAGNRTYKLGLNQFADLTDEEFLNTHTGLIPKSNKIASTNKNDQIAVPTTSYTADVPESIDWREKGVVTPIKDQGECGCCWAFATVAAVEGLSPNSNSLSEQQLLDCVTANHGCNGGDLAVTFEYIKSQGITSEDNYPYQGMQGTCQAGENTDISARISGYEQVAQNNEEALKEAVAKQPVTVAIAAGCFKDYQQGVFTEDCGTNLNHAVAIVGYGTEDGINYWLIKNSWGENWGESGYMKLRRDVEADRGLCGIATYAYYPIGSNN